MRTESTPYKDFPVARPRNERHWLVAAGFSAVVLMVAMLVISPPYPVFDEPYYLRYAQLFERVGLSQSFLRNLPGSPGPLIAMYHGLFQPATAFSFPAMRWANVPALALLIVSLRAGLRLAGTTQHTWARALMVLAIPVTWQMCGLVLSDLPAVLFLSASVVVLLYALSAPAERKPRILAAAGAGLLLGVSALGRQTTLAMCVVPALIALIRREAFLPAITYTAASVAVVLPVFVVWQGLTPPSPLHVTPGLSIQHLTLSFAYAGFFMLLLSPGFFVGGALVWMACLTGGALLNVSFQLVDIVPLRSFADSLGSSAASVVGSAASLSFIGVALYFVCALGYHVHRRRSDVRFLICALGSFWIAATPVAIGSNYASRYTALGLPLFVLLSSYFERNHRFSALRLLVGAGVGAASLMTYYRQATWELPWAEVLRFG